MIIAVAFDCDSDIIDALAASIRIRILGSVVVELQEWAHTIVCSKRGPVEAGH